MGVKIKNAWNNDLKKDIHVSKATVEMRKAKQFICKPTICDAKLTWSVRHKKNYNISSKFYRLLPHERHTSTCPNNTKGLVTIIAKRSNKKILKSISDDKFEFRLNLVFESNLEKEAAADSGQVESDGENKIQKNKQIKNKGNKLPYLSTMQDIMILRSKVEENKDLSSLIKLQFNGKNILWKNFYFELEEEEICYNYIKSKGYDDKERKKLSHLICSEFVLKEGDISQYKDIFFIKSTVPRFVNPNSNNEVHVYRVFLMTKEQSVVDKLKLFLSKDNYKVKLVGFYKPNISNDSKSYTKEGVTVYNHKIEGWINNKEQIVEVEGN